MKKLREHWILCTILFSICILIVIPGIINWGISCIDIGSGSDDAWLEFWGTYLGFIIASFALAYQMHMDRERIKKENQQKIEAQKIVEYQVNPVFSFSFLGDLGENYMGNVLAIYPSGSNKNYVHEIVKSEVKSNQELLYLNIAIQKPIRNVIVRIKYKFFDVESNKEIDKAEYFRLGDIVENSAYTFIPKIISMSTFKEFYSGIYEVIIVHTDYIGILRMSKLNISKDVRENSKTKRLELVTTIGETNLEKNEENTETIADIQKPENVNKSFVIKEPLADLLK